MANKYLDLAGLQRLVNKIKELIPTKTSELTNDSGFLTSVTKSDVGLGNVDNVKQASKTEFDEHNNDDTRHITSAERTKWNTVDNKVDKVTGKGLSTNDYTTAEKNKLAGIQAGAQVNTVTSVAGKTGAVTLSKSDVGLSNVDNVKQATKVEFDEHKADNTPHREAVSIERKNPDDDEVFTLIEFRRSDGTLFKTSQLNGISPYTSRTVKYYDKNGNMVQTVEYSITYSDDDEVISEVIISA